MTTPMKPRERAAWAIERARCTECRSVSHNMAVLERFIAEEIEEAQKEAIAAVAERHHQVREALLAVLHEADAFVGKLPVTDEGRLLSDRLYKAAHAAAWPWLPV